MVKEKRILSYILSWFLLGLFICFVGITKTDALVIDAKYLGQTVNTNLGTNPNGYIQGNSYITVDQSNALSYYVVDLCTTLGSSFNISNVNNQSGNVSYYKTLKQIGSCNTTNYDGRLSRIYFKINQWADAGNGNFGVIFTSRLNSTANYYSDIRILNIYTSDEVDNTSEIINNQTNELNNSINNSTNTITGSIGDAENNINSNINDMEQSIVDSNKETQDVIKDQFNSCRDSYQLIDFNNVYSVNSATYSFLDDNLTVSSNSSPYSNIKYDITNLVKNNPGKKIRLDIDSLDTSNYNSKDSVIAQLIINFTDNTQYIHILNKDGYSYTRTLPTDFANITSAYLGIYSNNSGDSISSTIILKKPILHFGETKIKYEPYGEKICTNKLDEQNETSKGILGKIGDLISYINPASENFFVYKLIDLLLDLLKKLFIPEDGYFELWFNDLKMFFEDKLGFLATPFTIIIDFINRYLDLNPSEDIIINIPDITVPNFEEHIIVKATTFNWSQLLKSKDSLNTLWQLYLSFVDVFLILNFINLCENKYNRIFGGDTTNYEYYTVEDSYNVDVNTGEVKSMRRNERKTTRKKVD